MTQLNAFVARSFDPGDERRIRPVLDFLETFRKVGFFCESAEAAEVESVSKRVRRMIDQMPVFIGFFTRRHPVYTSRPKVTDVLFGKMEPQLWCAPAWVLQESGYALNSNRKLILLREIGVEVPGLQGDLQYVDFDPSAPAGVFSTLSEMINGLLAEAAGTTVSMTVTQRTDQTQVAAEATVSPAAAEAPSEDGEGPDLLGRYEEMCDAANNHDLEAVAEAWRAGSRLIAAPNHGGIDQLTWDCMYFESRFTAGATDPIDELRRLRDENPARFEPKKSMAYCYHQAGEPGLAAPLYREAANSQTGRTRARTLVNATRAFLEAGRYDEALEAVKEALPIASDEIRDEAVSLHYRLLKKRGEDYLAFATAEAALHENPHLGVRFSLALDYRLKGLNELAFFHFKFLYDRDGKNSSSLHNLALLSSDCKLPIAAVERYRAAISSGETLSASNLGYIYLNAGMADEAKDLLGEAMKVQDHVPAVEKCLAEVLQRREGESEKQTEILGDAATRRGFFVDMGRALSAPRPAIDGQWRFPFGEMPLSIVSDSVFGEADIQRQENQYALLLGRMVGSGEQGVKVDTHVLAGRLMGAVCEFKVTVREKGDHGVLGVILGNQPSKSGFIVFAADGRSAAYVELSDSKLGKAEIIKRSETGG